jgi:hypothetical protein
MFSEDLQTFPEDLQLKTNLGQGLRALIKSSATCHISQPEKPLPMLRNCQEKIIKPPAILRNHLRENDPTSEIDLRRNLSETQIGFLVMQQQRN